MPAVPSRSRTATRPAMQVSARPCTAILMLHPGRRRPWLASGAHVKNMLHTLRQAQQSRPGPPTDRRRSSLPHGKAIFGCRAPLPPAWCTAGAPWARSGPLPAAVRTHGGRPTASLGTRLAPPPYLASPGPRAMLITSLERNGSALRAKVNVPEPARRGTSLQHWPPVSLALAGSPRARRTYWVQ